MTELFQAAEVLWRRMRAGAGGLLSQSGRTVPLTSGGVRGRVGSALVVVLTIVKEEFDAARLALGATNFIGDTNYYYRSFANGRYDIVLCRTADRGNSASALATKDLIEDLRPEFLLLVGIAGGMAGRDGVSLGDVVIADHVELYEMRKLVDGQDRTRRTAIDHPSFLLRHQVALRAEEEERWLRRVTAQRPVGGEPKIIVGNLIAGEKILGDGANEYQKKILTEFDKAIAVDMESHGVARAVYEARGTRHYNINYLVVRGISDLVDGADNNETRRAWRDYAASAAAAFASDIADRVTRLYPR